VSRRAVPKLFGLHWAGTLGPAAEEDHFGFQTIAGKLRVHHTVYGMIPKVEERKHAGSHCANRNVSQHKICELKVWKQAD